MTDTTKLFALDEMIATVENQLYKINQKINNSENNSFNDFLKRGELNLKLKSLKQSRNNIMEV